MLKMDIIQISTRTLSAKVSGSSPLSTEKCPPAVYVTSDAEARDDSPHLNPREEVFSTHKRAIKGIELDRILEKGQKAKGETVRLSHQSPSMGISYFSCKYALPVDGVECGGYGRILLFSLR